MVKLPPRHLRKLRYTQCLHRSQEAEEKATLFVQKARLFEAWIGPCRDSIMQLIVACSSADAKGSDEIKKKVIVS